MKKVCWLLVLLTLPIVACQDINEDLQNCTGLVGNSVTVTIKFKGPTGPLNSVVDSFNKPPTDALQTAPDEWKLTWNLSSTPVAPAFKFHVGATLKSGAPKIASWGYTYSNTYPSPPASGLVTMRAVDVSGLAMSVARDQVHGYVLRLENASTGPVTLQSLRWASSNNHIPLVQLLPGDPDVEALSWTNAAIAVPQVIAPGNVDVDIPDSSFLAANYALVRAIVGGSGGCAPEGIYESSTYEAVSAVQAPVQKVTLYQNYPNPFNPQTTIRFSLRDERDVTLAIYDANGQLVRELVRGRRVQGVYTVVWDGTDFTGVQVASGVYFYKMVAGSFTETKKMVLLK